MGMKSLIDQPKTHWAGDNFVSGLGVLQYWRMVRCRASVLRLPVGLVLLVINHLTVHIVISALQLE